VCEKAGEFGKSVTLQMSRFIRSGALPIEVHFVAASSARWWARRGLAGLRRKLLNDSSWISVPLLLVGAPLLLLLSLIGNVDAMRATRRVAGRGHMSSFVMRLGVDSRRIASVDGRSRFEDAGEQQGRADRSEKASNTPLLGDRAKTREPQYDRCIELKESGGLASLGLMTNQVWYDDPRRLTFLLARYKFVAKMLSGCRDVGEVGCGDAFGTRVVLQEVGDVTVYDFDRLFIEDVRERQDKRWPFKAEVHDIVAAPLPRKHQALFSLDVLEHIAPENEHAYLANLCSSLSDNGLLIIGTPSLESQPYASPPSKAGHVNCKSGIALKALLENYFAHVFIFSMNDEVVHTGFFPMAHYLFALCAGSKWEAHDRTDKSRAVSPSFEICELQGVAGFCVNVTYPGCEPHRVDGFATVADAAHWIGNLTLEWIRGDQPAS
jgi:hypothetical protein